MQIAVLYFSVIWVLKYRWSTNPNIKERSSGWAINYGDTSISDAGFSLHVPSIVVIYKNFKSPLFVVFCRISIILVQSWQDAQEMTENKIYGKREWHKGKIIRYMGKGNSTFHKRWPKIRYMGKRNGSRGNSTFLKNAPSRFFTSFVWTPLTQVSFRLVSTRVVVIFRYSKESRLHLFLKYHQSKVMKCWVIIKDQI